MKKTTYIIGMMLFILIGASFVVATRGIITDAIRTDKDIPDLTDRFDDMQDIGTEYVAEWETSPEWRKNSAKLKFTKDNTTVPCRKQWDETKPQAEKRCIETYLDKVPIEKASTREVIELDARKR